MTAGNGVALRDAQNGQQLDVFAGTDPAAVARAFKASGLFPDLQSEAQAFVKVMAGRELGIGPMASMMGINMIQGKVALSANLMASQVKASPVYDYIVRTHTEESCSIDFLQNGEVCGTSTFTMEDARRAGLVKSGGAWMKYPKALLFARTLSQGVRWYCPDVLNGSPAYVPEELGAQISEEGEAVQAAPAEEVDPMDWHRRSDDQDAERILDAENAAAERADWEDEAEAVEAEIVEEEPTITKARAAEIYDAAKQVSTIDPDSFAQAVAYAVGVETVGDLTTKKSAVPILAGLTEVQAGKVSRWILRKSEAATQSGGESGE